MSFCRNVSTQSERKNILCYRTLKQSTNGHKITFLLKNNTILLHNFRSAILGRGRLAENNSGYFPRWRITHHSFPDPLNLSRWRSSQISHPGDRCGCQNPNPRALYEVYFPWVARPPSSPSWGKPMIGEFSFSSSSVRHPSASVWFSTDSTYL